MASKKKESLLEQSERTARKALTTLEKCTDIVSAKLLAEGAEYNEHLASHLSWLAKGLVSTLEAARKLEASQVRAAKTLTPAEQGKLIRSWIADLPKDQLKELLKFVQDLAPESSVL